MGRARRTRPIVFSRSARRRGGRRVKSTCPLLICLDLQRSFANPDSDQFIPNLERPLGTCELVLRHARQERWRIAHCFRLNPSESGDTRPIRGFEPIAGEMVFRRSALSPYGAEAFSREMDETIGAPAFLMGFASAQQVLATIFDAISRQHQVTAILEAIHTPSARGVEAEALNEAAKLVLQGLSSGFSAKDVRTQRQAGIAKMLIGAGA